MSRHLERETDRLKKAVLELSALVEEAVQKAVTSIYRRDAGLARQVVAADHEIDTIEVEIEEECLKVLALHQPVANDLRFIIGVLKMDDELERMGDLASNIAQRSLDLAAAEPLECPFDLRAMAAKVQWMLGRAIDAVVNLDPELAREVWFADREVDAMHADMYLRVQGAILARPTDCAVLMHYMGVSRFLERIADHATSLAKDVLYMVEGEIVRHRGREFRAKAGLEPEA